MLFQLVTLPVEFDASRRALVMLRTQGILADDELRYTRRVLKSAALTYVASAAAAILQLLSQTDADGTTDIVLAAVCL